MTTAPAPTVVLVRGAFADSSGLAGVIRELQTAGHSVVAPPNPLRSLAFDAAAIAAHVGESCTSVQQPFPSSLLASTSYPTTFDAPGTRYQDGLRIASSRGPAEPRCSSVFADLHDLPPLLIQVGEDEILFDDATRIRDAAGAAGVDTTFQPWTRGIHVWPVYISAGLPESALAIEQLAAFLKLHARREIAEAEVS
jgi:acetyl esterase/lipase